MNLLTPQFSISLPLPLKKRPSAHRMHGNPFLAANALRFGSQDYYEAGDKQPLSSAGIAMSIANEGDVEATASLLSDAFSSKTAEAYTSQLKRALKNRNIIMISRNTNSDLVGCAVLKPFSTHATNRTANIWGVAVNHQWQNLGIGEAMMIWLIQKASQLGLTRLTLNVRHGNQAAINLYQKLGFEEYKQDDRLRYLYKDIK